MNRLVEYGSVEAIPYYNCSWRSFSDWEKTGVKKPWFGYPLILFGVLIELLYIPIIYIIFKTRLIRHPCYKIIVCLAMVDMSATCCSCLITGPLLVVGAVFCMYPRFTYIAGGFALNTWCMACAATLSLFTNRIISIGFREYAGVIEKKLAYSSIAFVLFYGFYIDYFTPTLAYNSDIMAWLPDPLSEEKPSPEAAAMYKNTIQAWNNWIFVTCMFILFSAYFMMVKRLAKGQKTKASKAVSSILKAYNRSYHGSDTKKPIF
uniref:G_PROTEIN_RECEP_F1_2 domain-containing protein n=1 Tax=Caenorhabditis tropicalis TaxID=1561998 RepID=A0A1I7TD59_9PELO